MEHVAEGDGAVSREQAHARDSQASRILAYVDAVGPDVGSPLDGVDEKGPGAAARVVEALAVVAVEDGECEGANGLGGREFPPQPEVPVLIHVIVEHEVAQLVSGVGA